MSKTMSHKDRARKVADLLGPHPRPEEPGQEGACEAGRERVAGVVARELYPTELLEAATDLLRIVTSEQKINERQWGMDLASGEIAKAERALALYEETP